MHAVDRYASAVVLGLGSSGVSAAGLLAAEGTRVLAMDGADSPELRRRAAELEAAGVRVILGARELPAEPFDVCIVSPGIPIDDPWLEAARGRGLRLMSELELGCSRIGRPILAISGTNGKSTLTKLCCDALRACGWRAVCAGNYGTPVCGFVGQRDALDWLVVEVSTFQLETTRWFRPEVAVLLNVQPDHLDRHASMDVYRGLKARLFQDMGEGQTAVVAADLLAAVRAHLGTAGLSAVWRTFGTSEGAEYLFAGGDVRTPGGATYSFRGSVFDNPVLGAAAAAAVAAVESCGGPGASVATAAAAFRALSHRMEPVDIIGGVRYIDDSKGTNLAAMEAALRMADGPVHLIAGGLLKEKDLTWVQETLVNRARGVYLIGDASERMMEAWARWLPCHACGTLERAVREASTYAAVGEVVLLSPGCASFDQYQSYKYRGEDFKRVVGELAKETGR